MKHLDLFSGIGGFALAASRVWPDHEVVAFCEMDKFCQRVLNKHWPNVEIIEDVRDINIDSLDTALTKSGDVPIVEDVRDVRQETMADARGEDDEQESGRRGITNSSENKKGDPKELSGSIDLLTGGFP